MQLRKKLNQEVTVSANYLTNGIALRVRKNDDQYDNAVVFIEIVDGRPRLVLFEDAAQHVGLDVVKKNINPEKW